MKALYDGYSAGESAGIRLLGLDCSHPRSVRRADPLGGANHGHVACK